MRSSSAPMPGLWRYMIGDTVRFTSLSPYRIQITGRTKHFINAFGEELIIDNAERALAEACSQTGAIIRDYTAAPVYFNGDECGAHEWIIEFEKSPLNLSALSTCWMKPCAASTPTMMPNALKIWPCAAR